ncbi:5-formyltetrahydrofolate cyclo-ligase [Candidatus Peregrinibacteria bacterium]|nr:5-formyltetrahydrofolate cyclo-ligase [Candidatus Peregrinibacteria bacterium]
MKKEIRRSILYKRTKQDPNDKKPKDESIINKISADPLFQQAKEILSYMPIHGEVDLVPLIDKFPDKDFILPRVDMGTNDLKLYKINDLDDVEKGSFDVMEPRTDLEQIPPEKIDLVFVPAVAYDKKGHRIGYGGGFYDKILKKIRARKIGVAYEFQIIDEAPVEEHDVPVDEVITESNIYK